MARSPSIIALKAEVYWSTVRAAVASAWSPLGRGVLTGKYRHSMPIDSRGANVDTAGWVQVYLDERGRRGGAAVGREAAALAVAVEQVQHVEAGDAAIARHGGRGGARRLFDAADFFPTG